MTPTAPSRPLRVLIVEDHDLLAQILIHALSGEGITALATGAPSAAEILEAARNFAPEVVLLDLDLGEGVGSSLPLIKKFEAMGAIVLMLTGATNPVSLAECIESGAIGLLSKETPFEEVVAAVAAAALDQELVSPADRHTLMGELRSYRTETRERREPFERLTAREQQVLAALTDGKSAAEIASESFVSLTTVRSQIRAVLLKLGVTSQLAAVALARQSGWLGS